MSTKISTKARIISTIILFCCFGVYIYRQTQAKAASNESSIQCSVFNTICSIHIMDSGNYDTILPELVLRLQQLHDCLNAYAPESELSILNKNAFNTDVHCSELLWDCIQKARKAYILTDGAFDITIGPLMKLWGFHEKRNSFPSDQEITQTLKTVGLDKILFDDQAHTVRFTVPNMHLDFGGIAKGYACDLAADFLLKHGITHFLLDFGGNLRIAGEEITVGIRDPNGPGNICSLALNNTTVATSGNYERSRIIDGKRVGHIMDAKTGRPGQFFQSVTAITPTGYYADALSTAVFVGGEKLARKAITALPETSFIVVLENGTQVEWK